jgi:cytidyltransferase-like protein
MPGTFNPPTRAHVALAEAALAVVDEVVFVLPKAFPHKSFDGATAEQRAEMLRLIAAPRPAFGAAFAAGGLYIDIGREAREEYPEAEIHLICGRDAAERIVSWDYGRPGVVEQMLSEFRLLVAPRAGIYCPPAHLAHAVRNLETGDYDACSSTRVRCETAVELVPDEIAEMVKLIYR